MAVVSLMPRNFFHPVWLGRPPTQASNGPGRRPESRPGHLSAGLAPAGPPWTPVPPAPAPWRPKPQGGGGGGEVAARRRGPRPAGFARGLQHAPRARSTWPRGR